MKKLVSVFLQEIPYSKPSSRLTDVDAARGIAILLVVVGHVSSRKLPVGNDWYIYLMGWIYRFHMPLFMVLTGITFALSLPLFKSWGEVFGFSRIRVKRLFIPYLVLGFVILAGKTIAPFFVHVDNATQSFFDDAIKLLIVPSESVARFLWFVYVLSIYLVLVPIFFLRWAVDRSSYWRLESFFNWAPGRKC